MLQQPENELRLRQPERALEKERKKAEADNEQKRVEIELPKGSSRASGSEVGDLESVESRRKLERSAGWAKSVAQQSGPSRPLSPNVVINPPKNITEDRRDKFFGAYPKTTPLFQPGAGFFSRQLQGSRTLKKTEIHKSIMVRKQKAFMPQTTFQQQGPSACQNKQRSQSPKHDFRNRSMESQNQTTVIQATPQVLYWPIAHPRGLPKLKQTEFSGVPLDSPEWAELGLGFSSQAYY